MPPVASSSFADLGSLSTEVDREWAQHAIDLLQGDGRRSADTHLVKPMFRGLRGISVYLKDESTHPTGSLKHRLARSLFLYGICNGRITIADDGPGLPEDQFENVFEPFVRLEGSRNRDTGGVGLGLAIARSIVRAHGGEITLANRPAGGLAATVQLPLERSP